MRSRELESEAVPLQTPHTRARTHTTHTSALLLARTLGRGATRGRTETMLLRRLLLEPHCCAPRARDAKDAIFLRVAILCWVG